MNSLRSFGRLALIALAGVSVAVPAGAEAPADRPFAMRGVELGITIDEFRQATIPNDGTRYEEMHPACSNDQDYLMGEKITVDAEDAADGIIECKWFSWDTVTRSHEEHWTKIGNGGGWPLFKFINRDGQLRLFEISFYANGKYWADILDALSRGYGTPAETIEPFKTTAGGDFTSATDVWDNGLSKITLVQRCGHLERYCLTYEHSALIGPYRDMLERRAAAAAQNI